MKGAKVLVAGADARALSAYQRALTRAGHEADVAADAPAVVGRLREKTYDLLCLDLDMEQGGTELLRSVKQVCPSTLVVVTARQPEARDVVHAFRGGAYDYLMRPVLPGRLREMAARAREVRQRGEKRRRLSEELASERMRVLELKKRLSADDPFGAIIGTSPMMRNLVENLREVARTESTVLLTGESGTGKGLAARTVHEASSRCDGPFVEANCVVYSEGVLHSELFGHEKGAFTGAARQKKGRFEMARGGTLFLDEIGEISTATQLLLLRVLQDRSFERVGGEETLEADVRLIAATNRDLHVAMERGEFRSDLFFRLNVIPVHLPPLRDHAEDIPTLAQHFVHQVAERVRRDVEGFTDAALDALGSYRWPGNIRELENVVERMVVLSRSPRLDVTDLPPGFTGGSRASFVAGGGTLQELEARRIRQVLEDTGGNKKLAAEKLGIHRSTLYAKMRRFRIDSDDAGPASRDSRQAVSPSATEDEKRPDGDELAKRPA